MVPVPAGPGVVHSDVSDAGNIVLVNTRSRKLRRRMKSHLIKSNKSKQCSLAGNMMRVNVVNLSYLDFWTDVKVKKKDIPTPKILYPPILFPKELVQYLRGNRTKRTK